MNSHALILVDLQNDFLPGGSLALPGSEEVIPVVNPLIEDIEIIVAKQNRNTPENGSFAANHPGKAAGAVIVK